MHPRRVRVDLLEKNGSISNVYVCTLVGSQLTMFDAKLLELGCANAEGDDLDNKYAKRR
jgi:hypothetical protein